jgi:hypothetical protein
MYHDYIAQFFCTITAVIYRPNENVETMEIREIEAKFACYLQLFEKNDVQIYSLSAYVKQNKKSEEVLSKINQSK